MRLIKAIELRKYGITANAYAPGVIDTTLREIHDLGPLYSVRF